MNINEEEAKAILRSITNAAVSSRKEADRLRTQAEISDAAARAYESAAYMVERRFDTMKANEEREKKRLFEEAAAQYDPAAQAAAQP